MENIEIEKHKKFINAIIWNLKNWKNISDL